MTDDRDRRVCCISGCSSVSGARSFDCELRYFRFPADDAQCSQWVAVIGKSTGQIIVPQKSTVICSKHFIPSQLGKKKLLASACPSVFTENHILRNTMSCCCPGCPSVGGAKDVKFHLVPRITALRFQWAALIGLANIPHPSYLCSLHFEPYAYTEKENLKRSAVPTKLLQPAMNSTSMTVQVQHSNSAEGLALLADTALSSVLETPPAAEGCSGSRQLAPERLSPIPPAPLPLLITSTPNNQDTPKFASQEQNTPTSHLSYRDTVRLNRSRLASVEVVIDGENNSHVIRRNYLSKESDTDALDTTFESPSLSATKKKCGELERTVINCKRELLLNKFSVLKFVNDDRGIRHHTGFPSYASFKCFFDFLGPAVHELMYVGSQTDRPEIPYELFRKPGRRRKVPPVEEFYLTMVRLRQGTAEEFLAGLYGISVSSVSKIVNTWILFIYDRLTQISFWPSSSYIETIRHNLPEYFRKFPKTKAIVDCTEFFIEKPSASGAQRETFSTYKHHNTAKALIAIDPKGIVIFASDIYSGRVSDKKLIRHCGLLDMLEKGDQLMVDKGSDIQSDCDSRGVHLVIPPFKTGNKQFSKEDVLYSRDISSCRVHSERAIRRIKEYKILSNIVPLSLSPMLPRIVRVCAYLTNFTGSIFDQPIHADEPSDSDSD